MQETAIYEANSLSLIKDRLDRLIADGHRIVHVIHHVEPKLVPYLQDRIHVLVIYEKSPETA
jgi:hypothetical protein